MAEKESPAEQWAAQWGEQWQQAQRRYWDAWMDMARQGSNPAAASPAGMPGAQAWAQALDQWWKGVSGSVPDAGKDLMNHMVGLGKAYFSMAEGLAKSGPSDGGPSDVMAAVTRWTDQMSEAFKTMTTQLQQPFGKPPAGAAAFWDLPMDTWQRTWSATQPFPGDWLKALHPDDGQLDPRAGLERFLSIPAVGYTREAQEQHQTLARLVLDYQQAVRDFQLGMAQGGLKAVEGFRRLLAERAEAPDREGQGKDPVTSVRQLYDLWVDACEDAYAEYAQSDDYAERYGRMVNALMAVKRQGALLVDEQLEVMNMPTRRELSTLQRRVQETRREQHALQAEIERLRERLDALAAQPAAAPAAPAPEPQEKSAADKGTAGKAAAKPAPKKKSANPGRSGRRQ